MDSRYRYSCVDASETGLPPSNANSKGGREVGRGESTGRATGGLDPSLVAGPPSSAVTSSFSVRHSPLCLICRGKHVQP